MFQNAKGTVFVHHELIWEETLERTRKYALTKCGLVNLHTDDGVPAGSNSDSLPCSSRLTHKVKRFLCNNNTQGFSGAPGSAVMKRCYFHLTNTTKPQGQTRDLQDVSPKRNCTIYDKQGQRLKQAVGLGAEANGCRQLNQ